MVGLVRNQNEKIVGTLEPEEGGDYSVHEAEVFRRERRLHAAGRRVENQVVEDTVAVEEDRGPGYFADSHFISWRRRRG
jgi:hypothetical protein